MTDKKKAEPRQENSQNNSTSNKQKKYSTMSAVQRACTRYILENPGCNRWQLGDAIDRGWAPDVVQYLRQKGISVNTDMRKVEWTAQLSPNWQNTTPAFLVNSPLKCAPVSQKKRNINSYVFNTLIPTSKFLRPKPLKPMRCMPCRGNETGRFSRLFLISKKRNDTSKHKPKKTKSRKTVSYSGEIIHNRKTYKVNAKKKQGIYLNIMHKAIDQLEISQEKWSRVLIIRFDLHQQFYRPTNKKVSNFLDSFKRRLQRRYGFNDIGFLWVREHERAKAQHYHFVIFLDGNKVRHSSKVLRIIKDTWERGGKNRVVGNHVPVIKNPFYFVDNEETKAKAIWRISYLCKERGKGYHGNYVNDYSTSRFTRKVRLSA